MDDMTLGRQAFAAKKYDDAIIHFTNAAEKPQNTPEYRSNGYNNRGFVLKALQRFDEAKNDFDHAILMNPKSEGPYINRGLLLQEQYKKYEDALKDYNYAIMLNPNNFSAYNNRGNLYNHHFKYYELALEDYNKALQLNPKSVQTYAQRGFLLATAPIYATNAIKLIQALKDFDEALTLDPNSGANYGWKSYILLKLDRPDDAKLFAETAIEKNPKSGIAYYVKARLASKGKIQIDFEIIQWYREFVARGCPVKELNKEAQTLLRQHDPQFQNPSTMRLTDVIRFDNQWKEICLLLNNAREGKTWRDLGTVLKIPTIELDDIQRAYPANPTKVLLEQLDKNFTLQQIMDALDTGIDNFEAYSKIDEFMKPSNSNSN